jgi:hypothetical protein
VLVVQYEDTVVLQLYGGAAYRVARLYILEHLLDFSDASRIIDQHLRDVAYHATCIGLQRCVLFNGFICALKKILMALKTRSI